MTVNEQIMDAVRKLGYRGEIQITKLYGEGRYLVFLNHRTRIGIYDIERKTFVD